ncbi:hypothetical protein PMAYCL1PPCAC_17476, partial [Pristionchus mayeri]
IFVIDLLLFSCRLFVAYFVCVLDDESRDVLGPLLEGSLPSDVIHGPDTAEKHMTALYWVRIFLYNFGATFEGPRWAIIGSISALSLLLLINYCVMIYCSVRIMRLLDVHASMHSSTLDLQRQLIRSLIGQMLFPLFTIYTAAFFAMIPPVLGIWFSLLHRRIIPNLCGIHPLVDGLLLMLTVNEYR